MGALPEAIAEWVVLIVDDHPDNLTVAKAALSFFGAKVVTANSGQEGLDLLTTVQPNLMLLDLSMPVMSGWTLFETIRSDRNWDDVPIVALTAHAMTGDREKVLEAGFQGYVPKPFNVATLVKDIQKAIVEGTAYDGERNCC